MNFHYFHFCSLKLACIRCECEENSHMKYLQIENCIVRILVYQFFSLVKKPIFAFIHTLTNYNNLIKKAILGNDKRIPSMFFISCQITIFHSKSTKSLTDKLICFSKPSTAFSTSERSKQDATAMPLPTSTSTQQSSQVQGTPDPYLTQFDPKKEHESYKKAQMRLEEEHREKVTKVILSILIQ